MRSHKIYWHFARSTEVSQDLQRSHKIYWDLKRSTDLAFRIWYLINIWYLTFDIDMPLPWHLTFDIHRPCHLTFGIDMTWHLTFDIRHWYMQWHLIFDISEGTDSTSTNTYDIGTILSHFHWWILRLSAIPKIISHSLTEQYWFKRC